MNRTAVRRPLRPFRRTSVLMLVLVAGALLANVTLKNGKSHSSGSGENRGGNILMFFGTVSNCVLRNGESYNAGSHGGGLAMTDGYATRLVLTGSKLARRGNGIAVAVLGGILDNSLITDNRPSTDTAQNAGFSMRGLSHPPRYSSAEKTMKRKP